IPMNDRGEILLDHYDKLLSSQTKIVAIAHIANSTGTLNPIAEMIQMAHDRGAKVLVDGAQSAAHLFVDVSALDADFFAFSGHKAFGPTGIGVLFGKKELLEKMPPYQGGGDMISQVSFEKTSYQGPPLKFEAGTPAIAQVIALGEALSFIERIGRVNLSLYEQKLLVYATEKLSSIEGLTILGRASNKGALITFTVKGIHPLDLGMLLDLEGIAIRTGHLCAQPALRHFGVEAAARISFAAYNTFEEVDRFVQALQNIVRSMRGL
ncbi:MAG: aminotransferase class V-fold PLP-dependent enzyme, partial [Anaerolineae bacterium]